MEISRLAMIAMSIPALIILVTLILTYGCYRGIRNEKR